MNLINNLEPETKLLYLDDSYQKEFDANVVEVIVVKSELVIDVYVVLNQTLFYPRGGGQPHDIGILIFNNKQYAVVEVIKREGKLLHKINKQDLSVQTITKDTVSAHNDWSDQEIQELKSHNIVHGVVDWDRRYVLMRMHTASHLVDAVLYRDGKILVTGNELGVEKTRIDFNMPDFNMDKVQEYIHEANRIIQKDLVVKNYYLSREDAFKIAGIVKLAGALPPDVPVLRITEIVGLDIQADGGTHVHSLSEIGKINILTIENKGKERKRIYFTLSKN